MKVRQKEHPEITGWSSRYNTHGLGEMIVVFDDGGASSEYIKDYEFQLCNGEWVEHRDERIVADDYNTCFGEVSER